MRDRKRRNDKTDRQTVAFFIINHGPLLIQKQKGVKGGKESRVGFV